jgi:hypothetical protein
MTDKRPARTVPCDGRWVNVREVPSRASKMFDRKSGARAASRGTARRSGTDFLGETVGYVQVLVAAGDEVAVEFHRMSAIVMPGLLRQTWGWLRFCLFGRKPLQHRGLGPRLPWRR